MKEDIFMKKIINDPQNLVDEMVQGMTRAYSSIVEQIPATNAIVRSDKASMQEKVGIVSGGVADMNQPMQVLLAKGC